MSALFGCAGKVRFDCRERAESSARHVRREDEKSKVHAYRCQHCRGWHIGLDERDRGYRRDRMRRRNMEAES